MLLLSNCSVRQAYIYSRSLRNDLSDPDLEVNVLLFGSPPFT